MKCTSLKRSRSGGKEKKIECAIKTRGVSFVQVCSRELLVETSCNVFFVKRKNLFEQRLAFFLQIIKLNV